MANAESEGAGILAISTVLLVASLFGAAIAADEPLELRQSWRGTIDHFATGVPLAVDTNADGRVDVDIQPASFAVTTSDVPSGASLVAAFLYWAGSIDELSTECAGVDDEVILTPPGGPARTGPLLQPISSTWTRQCPTSNGLTLPAMSLPPESGTSL